MSRKQEKSDAEEWYRMWANASFVLILIVVGVPLWWKTTEIYRVSLPYDDISTLHTLPHKLTARLTVLANDEPTASEVSGLIERAFQGSGHTSDIINLVISKRILPEHVHHDMDSASDEPAALEVISRVEDLTIPGHLYLVQRRELLQDVWVGGERVVLFRDEKAAQTIVEVLKQWIYQVPVLKGAMTQRADVARRTRFPPGDYHILLSVVSPAPHQMDLRFDAKEAVEDYIGSFVDELAHIQNFTVKSQWMHLLNFDFQAGQVKDSSEWGRHFAVRQDILPLFLTRLEDRAAAQVAELATVHLVLYCVPCNTAPLVIYDNRDKPVLSHVQAFMSPKWGGVVLANPTEGECRGDSPHQHQPSVTAVMGTFLAQLREMIGIVPTEHIEKAHLDPLRSVIPRRWELDALLRIRTLEQLTAAERALQSLAKMLEQIPYIVINDEVGASVHEAVASIHRALELLSSGHLSEACAMAREAYRAADTAAMAPNLLKLLYFPDDQKYAIYVPLFLPIMIPVFLSMRKLIKWLRGPSLNKEKEE